MIKNNLNELLKEEVDMCKKKINSDINYLSNLSIEELKEKYINSDVCYMYILILKLNNYISEQDELYITEF